MSNVLVRFRKISDMEFYKNGQELLHEIRSFLMNEKNIPKRQRMIYTYPIITMIQNMIDLYVKANKIWVAEPRAALFQAAATRRTRSSAAPSASAQARHIRYKGVIQNGK